MKMITPYQINAGIQNAGFVYSGQCACVSRIRTFKDAKHKMTIKHHQSSGFVKLYHNRVFKIKKNYEHFSQIIDAVEQIRNESITQRQDKTGVRA